MEIKVQASRKAQWSNAMERTALHLAWKPHSELRFYAVVLNAHWSESGTVPYPAFRFHSQRAIPKLAEETDSIMT